MSIPASLLPPLWSKKPVHQVTMNVLAEWVEAPGVEPWGGREDESLLCSLYICKAKANSGGSHTSVCPVQMGNSV